MEGMRSSIGSGLILSATLLFAGLFCTPGLVTPGMVRAVQPYSISPRFDLSKIWRIAVLPFGGYSPSTGADNSLIEHTELQLLKISTFVVVDRTKVQEVLREQEFAYSGVVDPGTASKLGKLLGANALMSVKVVSVKHDQFFADSPEQRDAEVYVRIVDVETGEVLYSARGQGSSFEGAASALASAVDVALLPLLEMGGVK